MRIGLRQPHIESFSNSRQIEVSRGVEPSVEEGVEEKQCRQIQVSRRCWGMKQKHWKEARLIHQLSRSYWGFKNFLDWSTKLSRICWDCDKKKFGSSIDSQVSRRCQDRLKPFFKKGKTLIWMQSSMQLNQRSSQHLSSQKHLSIKILSTMIPKTHTYTRQV